MSDKKQETNWRIAFYDPFTRDAKEQEIPIPFKRLSKMIEDGKCLTSIVADVEKIIKRTSGVTGDVVVGVYVHPSTLEIRNYQITKESEGQRVVLNSYTPEDLKKSG